MEAVGAANAAKGAKGAKSGGGGTSVGGVLSGIASSAMGAAQNVLGHAQKVAQKPSNTPEDSPLLSTEVKQKEAQKPQGAVSRIVNNYIDSTPKTPGGKMLSGAMQMGRGAAKLSKPAPQQTSQAKAPVNVEEVMGPEDVVKSIKKK